MQGECLVHVQIGIEVRGTAERVARDVAEIVLLGGRQELRCRVAGDVGRGAARIPGAADPVGNKYLGRQPLAPLMPLALRTPLSTMLNG